EPRMAKDEARGDAIGLAELRRVGVRRPLLVGERLPQPMHCALGRFAYHLGDLADVDALREAPRAVDVGLGHGSAGVGLERDAAGDPALTEALDELRPVALLCMRERLVQAMGSLQHGARADEACAREIRRADAGLRRPAGVQALGPGAFGEIFDDAARERP